MYTLFWLESQQVAIATEVTSIILWYSGRLRQLVVWFNSINNSGLFSDTDITSVRSPYVFVRSPLNTELGFDPIGFVQWT